MANVVTLMLLFCLRYESSFPTRGLGCRSVAHRDLAAARRNWLPAAKAPGGVNPPDSPCPTHLGLGQRVSQNGCVYTGTQTHTHASTGSGDVYWKYDDGDDDDDDDEDDTYVYTLTDGCAKVPRKFFMKAQCSSRITNRKYLRAKILKPQA